MSNYLYYMFLIYKGNWFLVCVVPEKYDYFICVRDWLYNKKSSSNYFHISCFENTKSNANLDMVE